MAKKPVTLDANGYRKFGMRDCLAYAAGDFGCCLSFEREMISHLVGRKTMQAPPQ